MPYCRLNKLLLNGWLGEWVDGAWMDTWMEKMDKWMDRHLIPPQPVITAVITTRSERELI